MRIIHLFCAVLLAGWSTPAAAQPSSGATEPERVVQAYHDAFNRQDLAGVLAAFAPDVVLLQFPADTVARGVDQIRRAHKDQFGILPGVRVEVRARTVEGQTVVEELVYHGFPCNKAYAERAGFLVEAGRIHTVTITPLDDFVGMQITVPDAALCFPPEGSGKTP
jgi:uncharacterized protein (TIGR02246 family)